MKYVTAIALVFALIAFIRAGRPGVQSNGRGAIAAMPAARRLAELAATGED